MPANTGDAPRGSDFDHTVAAIANGGYGFRERSGKGGSLYESGSSVARSGARARFGFNQKPREATDRRLDLGRKRFSELHALGLNAYEDRFAFPLLLEIPDEEMERQAMRAAGRMHELLDADEAPLPRRAAEVHCVDEEDNIDSLLCDPAAVVLGHLRSINERKTRAARKERNEGGARAIVPLQCVADAHDRESLARNAGVKFLRGSHTG